MDSGTMVPSRARGTSGAAPRSPTGPACGGGARSTRTVFGWPRAGSWRNTLKGSSQPEPSIHTPSSVGLADRPSIAPSQASGTGASGRRAQLAQRVVTAVQVLHVQAVARHRDGFHHQRPFRHHHRGVLQRRRVQRRAQHAAVVGAAWWSAGTGGGRRRRSRPPRRRWRTPVHQRARPASTSARLATYSGFSRRTPP
jgi:hypothetical protein